ncbi:MAG: hypothetical protein ACO3F2_02885 [Roseiflexaceae bacterium]
MTILIPHEWKSIALLVWRTPAQASRPYMRAIAADNPLVLVDRGWLGDVARWWGDAPVRRWLTPRWVRTSPLVARVLMLPWEQRIAVAQLVFGRILGPVTNPRALFYAFVQCAPLLDPAIPPHVIQPRTGSFACLHVRIQLAHGDRHAARVHMRQCDACRRADMALQRVRQALLVAVASMGYPDLRQPESRRSIVMRQATWMMAVGVLWIAPVLTIQRVSPIVVVPQEPRAMLQMTELTLFQPKPITTDQSQYWQVEIFWRFANQSVTWLNAEAWYQLAPNQYRTQLVHESGGNPYELDIVTPYQRLYHVTDLYAPHRLLSDNEPATVLMPNNDSVASVWQWRMRQGAWGMAAQVLSQALAINQIEVIGVSIGVYGEPLLRISCQTTDGEVWFDVAPRNGELMAIWQLNAQQVPELQWRLRQRAVVESDERLRYVVVQPRLGDYDQRPTQALHPAVPLISFDVGERLDNQISLWRFGQWQTINLDSIWLDAQ